MRFLEAKKTSFFGADFNVNFDFGKARGGGVIGGKEEPDNGEGIAVHMNKCGINIIEEMNNSQFEE